MVSLPSLDRIFHLKTPNFPQFRFEYHPKVKKVYLIRLGNQILHGDPIADNIETEGAAWMTVLVWLRGYREAKRELSNVKEQHKGIVEHSSQ